MRRAVLAGLLLVPLAACTLVEPGPDLSGVTPTVWHLDGKGLTVAGAKVFPTGLVPEVILGTGAVPLTGGTVTGPTDGHDDLGPYRETELAVSTAGLTATVRLRDRGRGIATVRLEVERAAGPDPGLSGFGLGPGGVSGKQLGDVLVEGYQSWSGTYDGVLRDQGGDPESAFLEVGDDGDDYRLDDRTSWWVGDVHGAEGDLLLGAVTADRFKTRVLTYAGADAQVRVHLVSGGHGPTVPFPAGAPERSERFLLVAGHDAGFGLETWARMVATWQPPVAPPFVPVGWNSWNTLFDQVTPADLDANAAALRKVPALAPNDLQLDDGWEKQWGDWTPNARFPDGLAKVAARLAHQGLHPGVWMAPFLAGPDSPVMKAHPAWRLVNGAGKPVVYQSPVGPMAVLDTSIPAAEDWVVGQVQDRLDEGFRYLKLDYLFAGAFTGARAGEVTPVQAYRHTLGRILGAAQAAGAYVLACGAPLLPTAGLAHGIRVSGDISLAQVTYSFTLVKNALRNVAWRGMVNDFLAVDPDAVRLDGLGPDGQETALTAALLAGHLFALGDDLPSLDDASRGRLAQAVAMPVLGALRAGPSLGYGARPAPGTLMGDPIADPGSPVRFFVKPDYPVPDLWSARLPGVGTAVAAFDWGEGPVTRTVHLAPFGWKPGRKVTDAWAGQAVTPTDGAVTVTLPAHGVVLWILR